MYGLAANEVMSLPEHLTNIDEMAYHEYSNTKGNLPCKAQLGVHISLSFH